MESFNIVDAAIAGDKESFMTAFNAALVNKVTDALEVKKVELASTLIVPQEEPVEMSNEVETTEEQPGIDGSDSAES